MDPVDPPARRSWLPFTAGLAALLVVGVAAGYRWAGGPGGMTVGGLLTLACVLGFIQGDRRSRGPR